MIVVRFVVRCKPGTAERVKAAFQKVVPPSREVEGALSFDIGRDVLDPDTFIATEVFEDTAALDRQEALPEVAEALAVIGESVAGPPEATVYEISSSRPWGA